MPKTKKCYKIFWRKLCPTHKDGLYLKWSCASAYDSSYRRERYLRNKKVCECGNLIAGSSTRCKKCSGKIRGEKMKGLKLPEWWKKKISKGQTGEKHHAWKGDDVSYSGLHQWIYSNFGKRPLSCSDCKIIGKSLNGKWSIQWANISGDYKRERSDWMNLCAECHSGYDKKNPQKTFRIKKYGKIIRV